MVKNIENPVRKFVGNFRPLSNRFRCFFAFTTIQRSLLSNGVKTFRPAYSVSHKSSRIVRVCCLLLVGLLCQAGLTNTATAATYYLDAVNGDDSNSGTSAEAWKTLNKAQSFVQSGDTVILKNGSYGAYSEGSISRTNWITYKADVGHNPELTKISINWDGPDANTYLIFDGFTIESSGGDYPISMRYTHHTQFLNLNVIGEGVRTTNRAFNSRYASNITIDNCIFSGGIKTGRYDGFSNGIYTRDTIDITITNNEITQFRGQGIMVSARNNVIRNNNIHKFGGDAGIMFGAGEGGITIENNKIHDIEVYYPELQETPTETTWSDDGTIMSNPDANWGSESEPLNWVGNIEIYINSGNNVKTGDTNIEVAEVISSTEIRFDESIKADLEGPAPSDVDYFLRDPSHADLIQLGAYSNTHNVIIRGNELYDSLGGWAFMHLNPYNPDEPDNIGGHNFIIENNLCWNVYPDSDAEYGHPLNLRYTDGLIFRNNIVIGRVQVADNYENAYLYNNIISYYQPYGSNPGVDGGDYNIVNRGSSNIPGEHSTYFNGDFGNPKFAAIFADYYNGDFQHASATSLGVGHGDPSNYPLTDILGNSRDASPDAGCYEYISGPPDTTPPSVPQNLTAQAVSESIIDLSWDASTDPESGVSYYKIYRAGSQIDTSVSTSYSNIGLNSGTTYSYEVSAVNGQGLESGRSNTAQATTLADTTPPSIVSVGASETSVEITFSEPLDTISAEQISNYSINGVSITAASLNTATVILTTSAHTEGLTYTLTVVDIQDLAGNPMGQTEIDYQYNQGLVGYWRFDEGSGTTAQDSSGSGNTGTLVNGPTWTTGQLGGALRFDGINEHVDIGAQDVAYPWTASFWVKREDSSNSNAALLDSSNYSLKLEQYPNLNKVGFSAYGVADYVFNYEAPIDNWAHLVFVGTQTQVALYVDGALAETIAASISCPMAQISSVSRAAKGTIDEVHIYNRALTAGEILDLYNVGTTNDPVLDAIGNRFVDETVTLIFDVNATDPDGDTITYSAQGLPSGATLDPLTGDFTWKPSYDQAGIYSVTFIAKDDNQASDSETITITVNNVNRPPILGAISDPSVDENALLSISVSASDPDGQALTYSVSGLPAGAVFASQTLTWTPSYDQAGTFGVTFTADDGQDQDSEGITITVINVNRTPVLTAINNQSVWADDPLTFTIDAADPDGDAVTYSASNLPSDATFSGQDFDWTPSQGQGGSYDVTFIASDGQAQDSQMVTITVDVDSLAPTVTNSLPTAGSIQAPLNNLINLNITDAGKGIDADSVTIKVNNNTVYTGDTNHYTSPKGNCRRVGNKADYRFVYQSNELFDYDQTMGITVTATDLAGNTMSEHSYSFVTEMRSFGKNKKVDLGNLKKGRPATVTDSNGDIWAAWHAGPIGGNRDIYIGKLVAEEEYFGDIINLTEESTVDQCNPVIAVGSDNKLYVAWQDNRQGNWDIYISTSDDGINWSLETMVNNPENDPIYPNQIDPAIVIDGQNLAYVVWQDDSAINQDIYIAASSDGFATTTVSQITSDISEQVEPAIAADSDNTIYVVWTDTRNNGKKDIYGAASNNGPWTNVDVVTEDDGQSSPAIATEADGSILHLVWVDDRPGDDDIYYDKTIGGLSPLTGRSIIDDDSGTDQISPVIITTAYTGALEVFACWRDERNEDADLYGVEIRSGDDTNVFVGDDGTNSDQSEPAIGIDGDGYPYLVWTNERTDICYAGSTFMADTLASTNVSISSTATVGTVWNAVNSLDDVSAEVPEGAYLCDVKITISKIKNPPKSNLALDRFTGTYEFGPSGMEFIEPVTITIPYEVTGSENVSYAAYWYNPLTSTLSQQGITDVETIVISPTLHALRFKTTHFSSFILGGAVGGGGGALLGGGGGGGGCSVSASGEGNIVEFFLPYIAFVVVLAILTVRDARVRKARNMTSGKI